MKISPTIIKKISTKKITVQIIKAAADLIRYKKIYPTIRHMNTDPKISPYVLYKSPIKEVFSPTSIPLEISLL